MSPELATGAQLFNQVSKRHISLRGNEDPSFHHGSLLLATPAGEGWPGTLSINEERERGTRSGKRGIDEGHRLAKANRWRQMINKDYRGFATLPLSMDGGQSFTL